MTIATLTNDSTKAVIFAYEKGKLMAGSGTNQLAAPGRRVGFLLTTNNSIVLNSNGWALFDAAVKWATEKPCFPAADVMFVIDRTTSMANRPLANAQKTATNFLGLLDLSVNKAGLISFASTSVLNHALSQNLTSLVASVSALTNAGTTTNRIDYAIQMAQTQLTGTNRTPNAMPVMIVLSAGSFTANYSNAVSAAKDAGILTFTVGLEETNSAALRYIASDASGYFSTFTPVEVPDLYASVRMAFALRPRRRPCRL